MNIPGNLKNIINHVKQNRALPETEPIVQTLSKAEAEEIRSTADLYVPMLREADNGPKDLNSDKDIIEMRSNKEGEQWTLHQEISEENGVTTVLDQYRNLEGGSVSTKYSEFSGDRVMSIQLFEGPNTTSQMSFLLDFSTNQMHASEK